MKKNIIKFIGIAIISLLFLHSVSAAEPIMGKRIAIGSNFGLFVDEMSRVWLFDAVQKDPLPTQLITENGKFVYTDEDGDTYYIIKKDGSLWGFGRSYFGQLGIKTKSSDEMVELRQILPAVRSIAVTSSNVFAIKPDGSLWAWGAGGWTGGTKVKTISPTPRKLMDKVKFVTTGPYFTFVLKEDNSLWGWGWNQCGGLGDGTTKNSYKPRKVDVRNLKGRRIDHVATYYGDSFAITKEGALWEWGDRHFTRLYCFDDSHVRPARSKDFGGTNIRDIAFGWSNTLILRRDGTAWFTDNDESFYPDKSQLSLPDVQEIASGYVHFAVLKKDGTVWAWKRNQYLDDKSIKVPTPRQMIFPK